MKVEKVKYLLLAQNMDRAVRFYAEVFQFQPGYVSDHWSELTFGDSLIALHGGGNGAPNHSGLSIQVDDAVAACASIRQGGGKILSEPAVREGEPIKLGSFRDPEGNEVMLTEFVG